MKWDGEEGFTGILAVSLIIIMIIIDIYGFIHLTFFFEKYGSNYDNGVGKPILGVLMFLIIIIFYIRYRKHYRTLKAHWVNETKQQSRIRGFLVILAVALPIALPILYLSLFR